MGRPKREKALKTWTGLGLLLGSTLLAQNASVIRNCRVYDKASKDAALACSLKQGDSAKLIHKVDEKIVEIESEGCKGFLYASCLRVEDPVMAAKKEEKIASQAAIIESKFKLGVLLEGELPAAKVGYSTTYSKGYGFGIGMIGEMKFLPYLSAQFFPLYRYQKLSRSVDGTGSVADPNPSEYSQKVWELSLAAALAYHWNRSYFRLGGEFVLPTAATQTDRIENDVSFKADKMFNLLVGSGFDFPVTPKMGFRLGGDFFYHLTAKDSTQLFGIRVAGTLLYLL